ncbi:MAG: hypothetical protein JWP97_4614 [Labilithrix sp.]|nr:hypothetical protein [Labilithrix sp.]
MGQRSSTVTVIELVQAFLEQRTWTQKALADRLEMTSAAVRERLKELEGVFNLERQEDHPHVYWSVPKDWFPGGVVFTRDQLPDLLRLLLRLPQGKQRDNLLETVLRNLPKGDPNVVMKDGHPSLPSAVVPPTASKQEEQYLSVVEDAAARKVPLGFHYFTASRGLMSTRHASVQRVVLGRTARFVAMCHREDKLKWFRIENIVSARLDSQEPFRPAETETIEQFLRASVEGFNAGGAAAELSFVVREPESRWVQNNLLSNMRCDQLSNSRVRVTVETNAILQVARYVVGLGAAAVAETPALADAVEVLARGALGERAELVTDR